MSENKRGFGGHGGGFGGPGARMMGGKAKDFKGTGKKLLNYLKPYSFSIIVVFIFAIASAAFSIVGPKILGKATTKLFEGLVSKVSGQTNAAIDFDYIGKIILLLVGLYIISAVFSYVQGYIMSGIAQKVSYNLRKEISEKVNRMPLKYFDRVQNGEVLSRVTNDVDTVSNTLNQSLSQTITSVTSLIGILIMMFSISFLMTLAALIIIPLSGIVIAVIVKKSQGYFKSQQKILGKLNSHVEETYGGHLVMKAYNHEKEAIDEFNKYNDSLYDSAWKSQFLSGLMMPIMSVIGNIGYVVISILGGWLTIKNKIEVGDILSFVQYIRNFMQPIAQTAQIANILQSTAAAAERVFEFLEEEEEVEEISKSVNMDEINGDVTFNHVHFGYNDDKIIINDFSSKIKAGQRIAIVGPTGAGKTTIVKLLMRFYELNSGEILLDGKNINEFKRNDLRKAFGMVLQDTWLFNGTIMDNIRYGNLEASDKKVHEACRAAHVDSFIKTLPDGYNMILNEEASNVSQGQKQLLTIARAILADPKILILDEATSSVDTRTEVLIQKAMNNLMKGRTSFIIAHRLSTIKNADLILVMNQGDIVEQGTHEELINKKGFYEKLYNSQFEINNI